jgi:type IV pilus assembly protein PilE
MKTVEKYRMVTRTMPSTAAEGGFTLIELMITVAILGIVATIATTSYSSQIQKSRRTDARSALLDLAGREEKLFSTTNAYSAAATDLGYANWTTPVGSNGGDYLLSVVVNAPANPPSYTLTATATGVQAGDTQCTTLSIDQTGNQMATGSATASTCWGN